jgi:hypothetical protein
MLEAELREASRDESSVSGRRRDQAVTFRFTSRGSGKSRRPWTEIDVTVPPGQLSFALREQTGSELRLREKGLVVDVETGDELFDDAFIVEAAPADVARALLGEELRARLLAARPFAVVPRDGVVRVEVPGHILMPGRAVALIELAARLAEGFRPAHVAADVALEAAAPRDGSPYRAEPGGGEAVRAAKRARLDEVAALFATQERRRRHHMMVALVIVGAIVAVYVLLAWGGRQ